MRKAALAGLAVSALAAVGPVRAQHVATSLSDKPVGEVIVQGRKAAKGPESFAREVQGFVAAQAQPSPIGVLSRWMTPICPTVVGLTPTFTDLVVKRIGDVAARMGAPHGRCGRSNVRVVFTAQPQQLMDYVRARLPDLLGYHFLAQEDKIATFQEPIDSWHLTATRDESGARHVDDPYNQKDPVVASGGSYVVGKASASRLTGAVASDFKFALVVVDSSRVGKQPIGRIADQIAMLVLTNPKRPKACSPLPSLLDSLDSSCPESASIAGLTPYDEAFLKALYSSDPEEKLALERGEIAGRIRKLGPPDPGGSESERR
jgi:hypothetical protein